MCMLLQSCESPRATGSIKSSLASEVALGGCRYSTFIQTCAGCLKKEKIINVPQDSSCWAMLSIYSMYLIQRIDNCIVVGSKRKLPSSARGDTWSAFHKLWCNDGIRQRWNLFVTTRVPACSSAADRPNFEEAAA